uniref:Deacetylase sirtuin-type domain-containing protein n=1 Tax=Heterorhabditis bacteriophora TaxID=37862 RepID=A0A1I7X472_HETBA
MNSLKNMANEVAEQIVVSGKHRAMALTLGGSQMARDCEGRRDNALLNSAYTLLPICKYLRGHC